MTLSNAYLIGMAVGILLSIGVMWIGIDACRAGSPTGQCAVSADVWHGFALAQIQWPTK